MRRELHVLMLEDSEDDALLVLLELQASGYEVVHTRTDSASGLRAALEQGEWDIVISDYNMPGFTGIAALRTVRELRPDLPFVFVSGTIGEETAVDAMRSGANDYVMKGHLKRLAPAIERELRDAETRRERRRIEEALRQSERRFSKVFHTASVGIAVTTITGARFVEVNEAFGRIVGDPNLVGRTLDEVGLWPETSDYDRVLEQLRQQGTIRDLDLVIRRSDGTPCPVMASFEHIEVGGEVCLLSLMHDVSERLRLEGQLRQAQKMEAVGRLAGGVAHDFNNLLMVIMGYCTVLNDELSARDKLREDVTQIQLAAERAATLTGQLLAFSRRQVVEMRSVNLSAVVAGIEPMLRRLIPENITLSTSLAKDLGAIRSDPGQLEQIIMNLVVNARDAMPEGGDLILETAAVEMDPSYVDNHVAARVGPYILLAVGDTGVGMSEEIKAQIFEPFFTTKGMGEGTGLGLATVYGAVKQNDGFIWVYSEPGRGSTFKLYFPRIEAVVEEVRPGPVSTPLRGTETILLVEDEGAVRKLARDMLVRQGYRVMTAEDGVAALALVTKEKMHIDLLVTDVVMPRMGGRELAGCLKQVQPDLRVLYTSGYTDDMVVRQDLVTEGSAFLQKPFTPTVLWKKVRSVLDSSAVVSS